MRVPAVLMRGGTSRALFFHARDLPADPEVRDAFILAAYGSPDPDRRQVDGLGGATSSTSKVAVISPGRRPGVDVLYDFGQVSIDHPLIDRRGNCGNISSAVGPFAVDEGLVQATDPVTQVRFLNVNTNKLIVAHVPTRDGAFDPTGTFELPGVPGTGAPIQLDYVDPAGSVTGRLLPTGRVRDELDVPGVGVVPLSLIDAANPLLFVRWESLGLTGQELPDEIDADPALLARIELVRAHAAVLAGIATTPEQATAEIPSVPKLAFVGAPQDYSLSSGRQAAGIGHDPARGHDVDGPAAPLVRPDRWDLHGGGHRHPGDGRGRGGRRRPGRVPDRAPAGVLSMSAAVVADGDDWLVESVSGYRTARRLMEGTVLVPDDRLPAGCDVTAGSPARHRGSAIEAGQIQEAHDR